MVNCQNSQDKGPPEFNSARGEAKALFHNNTKYAFHTKASLRASSQITASSYILEQHL